MISRRVAARALDVPTGTGPAAVRRAFRRRAAVEHPDRGGDAAKFAQLVEARDRLLEHPPPPPHVRRSRGASSRTRLLARLLERLLAGVTAWEHRRRFGHVRRDRVS